MQKQTFSKRERLKSQNEITELFKNGNIIHHYPFKVLYKLYDFDKSIFPSRIAVSASKRNFKKAVVRNRIKRKIRETYRINKPALIEALIKNNKRLCFFVIYTAAEDLAYKNIDDEMKKLINKLIHKLLSNKE
jgi:ribonuclease P protein component